MIQVRLARIGTRSRHRRQPTLVQQNDRFSELSAGRVFAPKTRVLMVRNTRFEKTKFNLFEVDE
jgi:hypothetical protein